MPMAICCGEPEGADDAGGADDADGAGAGWLCCCASCWAARCACCAARSAACRAAAAAALCSARRRAAASRAAACRAASCRAWAESALAMWTCEASIPLPSGWSWPSVCRAELARAAVSELAADRPGAADGQSTTTPEATAAVTTVEPATAVVILEGLLWLGDLRRRCRRVQTKPCSGARRALGFHPVALPGRRRGRGGQRRTCVTRVRATSCPG